MGKRSFTELLLIIILLLEACNSKPISYTQITRITSWWPEENIAKSIGVPGYANAEYNYFSFGTWASSGELGSIANVYAHPISTFGSNFLGNTDESLRKELKAKY
jgi:hypothetical protein